MSHVVTIDLPPDVAERVQAVAARTHQPVEEILLDWLGRAAHEIPIEWLPDAEILALSDLEMSETEQHSLSELLEAQREGLLSASKRIELDHLLHVYRSGMVRKAQALRIAVERGLRSFPSE